MALIRQLSFFSILFILCFSSTAEVITDRPILDANGNPTGSYNANPDPDGEPWIYRPLEVTRDVLAKQNTIPEWKPEIPSRNRNLPRAVNNFKKSEFHKPVLRQIGGSCSAASGTGHHYTWEANVLTGADGSQSENKSMYFYPYNFLNDGVDKGIWYYWAWDILKKVGCVKVKDWPSSLGRETFTEWPNTYEAYHNANFTRLKDYYQIKDPGGAGLEDLKAWFHDHGRGDAKGGCVTFNAGISFGMQTIPQGSPEAGHKIATSFDGTSALHAMMFAGYNDDVYLNENDKGAVLLVNSWGSNWGTNGALWVPYSLFKSERDVYLIEVVDYIPRLEFKVKLKGYGKTNGSFTSGFAASETANSPTKTQTYGKAFRGNKGSFDGEIGLDATELWQSFADNGGYGKFFLTTQGSGTVESLSLMVYDETGKNLVKEIKCDQSNVSIPGTLTITCKGDVMEPYITVSSPKGGEKVEQYTTLNITWTDNIDDKVKIDLHKAGSFSETIVASTESDGRYEWLVPADMTAGDDYTIVITSVADGSISDESNNDFSITKEFLITDFPYEQSFDDWDTVMNRDFGDWVPTDRGFTDSWTQLGGDDIEWSVWTGPTPSKIHPDGGKTGPDGGKKGSGNYIFIEASTPNTPAKSADFITPKFSLKNLNNPKLSMWLHMYDGAGMMGTLAMDICVDGTWHKDVQSWGPGKGDSWFLVEQDLSEYKGDRVQFRFRGVTGTDWASDICIDDFSINNATPIAVGTQSSIHNLSMMMQGGRLNYSIPQKLSGSDLTIDLYDLSGRRLFSLKRNGIKAGSYALDLSTGRASLASGMYVATMRCGDRVVKNSIIVK